MEFVSLIYLLILDTSHIELLIPALPKDIPFSVLKSPLAN
jgi:hypothetical protein